MTDIEHEPSERLLDLIFAALDVGIDTARATNGGMHPFVMFPGEEKPSYKRVIGRSMDESIQTAQRMAAEWGEESGAYAICVDGYLHGDGGKMDAVLVEAAEQGDPVGFIFGQRYRPAEDDQPFEVVGRPVLAKTVPNRFPSTRTERSMVLFHKPGFGLDDAARALKDNGLKVKRKDEVLEVRWGKSGPTLFVRLVRGDHCREAAARMGQGTKYADLLATCDAVFEIAFDDLDEVLDDINTLIEVQTRLELATGGVVANTWNGNISKSDPE